MESEGTYDEIDRKFRIPFDAGRTSRAQVPLVVLVVFNGQY
jgi:hypothetical protein